MKRKIFFSLLIIFILWICFIFQFPLHAQLANSASGRVTYYNIEYAQQRPLVNVKIKIETLNPSITYNLYTDVNGDFGVDFPSGIYPTQATAYLFFENSKIEIRGVSTIRSAFVNEVNIGLLGPCPPPPFLCTYELGTFTNLNIDFMNGSLNNDCANMFKLANAAADFSITNGYTPPRCVIKYPAEISIISNKHVHLSSFYWPFSTHNSDDLAYIVGSIFPFIGITYLLCDCTAELTERAVYLEENLIQTNYRSTIFHEYGHFLMHSARGWNWPVSLDEYINGDVPYQHSWGDIEQHERLAFLEGFANFFASAVESWLSNPSSPYEGRYRTDGYDLRYLFESPGSPYNGRPNGYKHEVLVGSAFFDFYDPPSGDDLFQSSFANILNVIAERKSTMTDYIAMFARKPFLTGQQRNAGINIMYINQMDPVIPYGNVTLKVKNDFDAGIVNIDGSNLNTSQQPTPGIVEQTQLWMSSKRLQAIEQTYGNYQRLFKHTHPENPTHTWATLERPEEVRNFTEIWDAYSDQLTYKANFDRLCNVAVNYISYDGVTIPGSFSGSYRSGKNLILTAPDHIINGITHKFIGWSDGLTQNPRNIFVNEHFNLIGYYKGHLISNSSSVLNSNSQRKLVSSEDGINMHLVYESGGHIWYTKSSNSGTNWSIEEIVSLFGDGLNSSPSVCIDNYTNSLYVVWHWSKTGSPSKVLMRKKTDTGWSAISTVSSEVTTNSQPVISIITLKLGKHPNFTYHRRLISAYQSSYGVITVTSSDDEGLSWLIIRHYAGDDPTLSPPRNLNTFNVGIIDLLFEYQGSIYTERYQITDCVIDPPSDPGDPKYTYDEEKIPPEICAGWTGVRTVPGSVSNTSFSEYPQSISTYWELLATWKSSPYYDCIALTPEPVITKTSEEEINITEDLDEIMQKIPGPGGCHRPPPRIAFQRFSFAGWLSSRYFSGTNFRNPSISHLSTNRVILSWDDGSRIWRTTSTNGGTDWASPSQVECGTSPNLSVSGGFFEAMQSKYVYRSSSGALHSLNMQSGVFAKETELTNYKSRSVSIVDTSNKASIYFEFSPLIMKSTKGVLQEIPLLQITDSLTGFSLRNILQTISTSSITFPKDVDSIFIDVTLATKSAWVFSEKSKKKFHLLLKFKSKKSGETNFNILGLSFKEDHFLHTRLAIPARLLRGRTLSFEPSFEFINNDMQNIVMDVGNIYNFDDNKQELKEMLKARVDLPSEYLLDQNYPNPFNPVTQISYALPDAGYVTLKIYDVLGREVATLVNEFKEAGYYAATWDATNIPSGVYFYKLQSGNFTSVKKMLLVR